MAHLAERENDRLMAEQKNTGKKPWSAPTPHHKDKQVRRTGQFRAQLAPQTLTTCPTYGCQHPNKEYWRCSSKCFNCGEVDHRANDCKKPHKAPKKNKIVYRGRVFALTEEEAQGAPTVVSGTLLIDGHYAKVLFDSSVTHSFISHVFANSIGSQLLRTY